MARQRGIIKLDGTLDDLTFQKTRDGYRAKVKGEVPASRIASDPAFQRTRENNAEFGRAGKAGKLLRIALRSQLQRAKDGRMVSRLTTEMLKVLQADTSSARGERNVIDGELGFLKGFDFNVYGKLTTCLFAPYTASINRATGECTVSIPSFTPADMVTAPAGATHFRIFSAAAEVDFLNQAHSSNAQESPVLAWDHTATAAMNLVNTLAPNSAHPLFLTLGIEFYQEVNGTNYPLKSGSFNALAIVQVDAV